MGLTQSTQSASQQSVPSSADANDEFIDVPDEEGQSILQGLSEEDEESLLAITAQDLITAENARLAALREEKPDEEKKMDTEDSPKQTDKQEKEDAQEK